MNRMTWDANLEMTYRRGKPLAGYLWLNPRSGVTAARTREMAKGLVVDFAADGSPIGIEIIYPTRVTLAQINAVLEELHCELATEKDLAPLLAVGAA